MAEQGQNSGVFSLEEAKEKWRTEARGTPAEGMRGASEDFLKRIGTQIAKEPPKCIPTGLEAIDLACGGKGLPCGYSHILSGPSGFGKSLEAVQLVEASTRAGHVSAIVSGEMGAKENLARLLAKGTGCDYELLNPFASSYSKQAWHQAADQYNSQNRGLLWVNEHANIRTLEEVLACVNFVAEEGGAEMVMVDYGQYFTVQGAQNKKVAVDTVARELDALAKDLDICVLLLSQLRRSSYTNGSYPTEADQEYSQSLTQNARTVSILDPSHTCKRDGGFYYRWRMDKNRGGRKVRFCVRRDMHTLELEEMPNYQWFSSKDLGDDYDSGGWFHKSFNPKGN